MLVVNNVRRRILKAIKYVANFRKLETLNKINATSNMNYPLNVSTELFPRDH
jgi:hypothetical protein